MSKLTQEQQETVSNVVDLLDKKELSDLLYEVLIIGNRGRLNDKKRRELVRLLNLAEEFEQYPENFVN